MRKYDILIVLLFAMLVSCNYDIIKNGSKSCNEAAILKHNMVEYRSEEITNQFYLSTMVFEGRSYYQLGCHLADIVWDPVDCNDVGFCTSQGAERCLEFELGATENRIIGIEKQ